MRHQDICPNMSPLCPPEVRKLAAQIRAGENAADANRVGSNFEWHATMQDLKCNINRSTSETATIILVLDPYFDISTSLAIALIVYARNTETLRCKKINFVISSLLSQSDTVTKSTYTLIQATLKQFAGQGSSLTKIDLSCKYLCRSSLSTYPYMQPKTFIPVLSLTEIYNTYIPIEIRILDAARRGQLCDS